MPQGWPPKVVWCIPHPARLLLLALGLHFLSHPTPPVLPVNAIQLKISDNLIFSSSAHPYLVSCQPLLILCLRISSSQYPLYQESHCYCCFPGPGLKIQTPPREIPLVPGSCLSFLFCYSPTHTLGTNLDRPPSIFRNFKVNMLLGLYTLFASHELHFTFSVSSCFFFNFSP